MVDEIYAVTIVIIIDHIGNSHVEKNEPNNILFIFPYHVRLSSVDITCNN